MRAVLSTSLLILLVLLPAATGAQAPEEFAALDSREFTHAFGPRQVTTQITLRAGGNFAAGRRAYLQIDLDSTLTGAADSELAGTTVVNGYVVLGLPPGLEPDGEPRLFYFDSAKGRYEFMYSKAYPNIKRLEGLGQALQDAASTDPQRILKGLEAISHALDPAVEVGAPGDPRLTGGDPSYSVTGVSWLLPCNVWFKSLVGLFDPEDSIEPQARLRVSLPVKASGPIYEPQVAVYAGGLSAAVAKVELMPADIPPTALPLAPLPEPPAEPAAAGEPGASADGDTPGPATESGNGNGSPSGAGQARPRRPQADDAPPAAPQPAEGQPPAETPPEPPPPPQPIPTLIYSYEWLAWETEMDLAAVLDGTAATPAETAPPTVESAAGMEQVSPADPAAPAVEAAEPETTPSAGESVEISPPPLVEGMLVAPADGEPPVTPDAPTAVENAAPAENDLPAEGPPVEPETAAPDSAAPEAAAQEMPAAQEAGVREVAPGTLPPDNQTYTVPLKPITGSGAAPERSLPDGGAPLPPVDPALAGPPALADLGEMLLIPEGYFLMGTGGTPSAGDEDELPQTKVYLPAYLIDKYPVTNRQFMEFVLAAGYKPEGNWDKYYTPGTADLPVRYVTWNDASAFAAWARKRLPTEAEWEKAARGADGATYPWGEEWSADILPRGEQLYQIMTAPRGASPYGVMGMCGLVWQWTASAYAPYPFDPEARGDKRVLRGGCYSNGRNILRCANRYSEAPNVALNTFGFRCVKDAPPAS